MAVSAIMHPDEVTRLLQAWRAGDQQALEKLAPLIYAELHRVARSSLSREHPGHTLETTALVHAAYTRLIHNPQIDWRDGNHLFAVCLQVVRRVLVDQARTRASLKRGRA